MAGIFVFFHSKRVICIYNNKFSVVKYDGPVPTIEIAAEGTNKNETGSYIFL